MRAHTTNNLSVFSVPEIRSLQKTTGSSMYSSGPEVKKTRAGIGLGLKGDEFQRDNGEGKEKSREDME